MTDRPGQTGSATVWVVAAIAVVVTSLFVALAVGQVATARSRAAAAADAAALAGAAATLGGPAAACGQAATLARANGAVLTGCTPNGAVVTVSVSVRPSGLLRSFGGLTAKARAGPVGSVGVAPNE